MANTVFNAHKPARELPISRSTSKLLEEVDKQLKNLTTDVRHTYGREFIMLLLEMRRLIRKANAAQTLEEKAERIAGFIDAYDDLADLLKLKTYLEEPGWDFKKIQPLNQYTSITKIKKFVLCTK